MTTEIKFIDRDAAIAAIDRPNEAKEQDEIADLRKLIIELTKEIDQKQQELFAIQSSLASTIQRMNQALLNRRTRTVIRRQAWGQLKPI